MKLSKTSGAAVAAAAAALFLSGAVHAPTSASAEEAKVQCFGVNSCKGHSACKTANSSCKGLNDCSGKGFQMMTAAECTTKGGTTSQG